jgi:hypothetical protein
VPAAASYLDADLPAGAVAVEVALVPPGAHLIPEVHARLHAAYGRGAEAVSVAATVG